MIHIIVFKARKVNVISQSILCFCLVKEECSIIYHNLFSVYVIEHDINYYCDIMQCNDLCCSIIEKWPNLYHSPLSVYMTEKYIAIDKLLWVEEEVYITYHNPLSVIEHDINY